MKKRGVGRYVKTKDYEDVLNGDIKYIYDENFHPQNYIDLSKQGLHKVHIICEWNIPPYILNKWMAKNPALQDAYFMGKAWFQVYWIDYLKENLVLDYKTTFNQRGWEQIIQYGELNTRERMISITGLHKKKSLKAKNQAVLEALCEQLITLSEAHQLQELICKQAKICEVADLLTKVQEIEEEYGKK